MKKPAYSVAVVGATGLVGQQILDLLGERGFPIGALQLYASLRTAGDLMRYGGVSARVDPVDGARFDGTDLVFLASGERVSAEWAPRATQAGAIVIDTTQLFAGDIDVPLVVPEVNASCLAGYDVRGIVASPDAVAIAGSIALEPIRTAAGLTRVVASTFEPVSGAGRAGVDELQQQTVELMSGRSVDPALFSHRIAFNLVPQIGEILAGGAARDEANTVHALRRLLDAPDLGASVTRVRAPLFYGTAISLNIETAEPLTAAAAYEIWRSAPGMLVEDDVNAAKFPTPVDAVGQDAICLGRIRADEATNVLDVWIVFDNVRKGSATNAVQLAELLIRDYL